MRPDNSPSSTKIKSHAIGRLDEKRYLFDNLKTRANGAGLVFICLFLFLFFSKNQKLAEDIVENDNNNDRFGFTYQTILAKRNDEQLNTADFNDHRKQAGTDKFNKFEQKRLKPACTALENIQLVCYIRKNDSQCRTCNIAGGQIDEHKPVHYIKRYVIDNRCTAADNNIADGFTPRASDKVRCFLYKGVYFIRHFPMAVPFAFIY